MKNSKLASICLFFTATLCQPSGAINTPNVTNNEFNPAISLILDGRYTDLDMEELSFPGFQLGGEAELPEKGFSTGHNELTFSANIDDRFYGSATIPIVYQEGETTIELEDAYIETLGLGQGVTVKLGKFYSALGYLNSIHDHAHDFADRPLVYDVLIGGHLSDTGVQLRWVAPTAVYLGLGVELTRGSEYPGGRNEDNHAGEGIFVKVGGDLTPAASWQVGLSHYTTEFDVRQAGAHHHGGEESLTDNELRDGEVDLSGLDLVFKWSPSGHARERYLKLQAEAFKRDESGQAVFFEELNSAEARYSGEQSGYYLQAIYQFAPRWRVGLRHDVLQADNSISRFVDNGIDEQEFLQESSIGEGDDDPSGWSGMLDFSPSEYSRIRLQVGRLEVDDESYDSLTLQYLMSLGAHGAHTY